MAFDQLEYEYALERYHIEMAANLRDRLARMDEAIELMQDHPQGDGGAIHRTLPRRLPEGPIRL